MKSENARAIRLLQLHNILVQQTDEAHPFSINDLLVHLKEYGTPCSQSTLYEDLKLLDSSVLPIKKARTGHKIRYYGPGGVFTRGELRILFDAVQACGFIPEKETDDLIHKISVQDESFDSVEMKNTVIHFNCRKHTNHEIFASVEHCEKAILDKKQVSFSYFHLDYQAQPLPDYEKPITVDPFYLIFHSDQFYLVAYSPERQAIRHYRLDRMMSVSICETARSENAERHIGNVDRYLARIFSMYGGHEECVTLEFTTNALGAVYDKFGESAPVERIDKNRGSLTQTVEVSGTFFGWVVQFGGEMKITAPKAVIEEFKAYLENVLKDYSE